jgi:hypothetical protein
MPFYPRYVLCEWSVLYCLLWQRIGQRYLPSQDFGCLRLFTITIFYILVRNTIQGLELRNVLGSMRTEDKVLMLAGGRVLYVLRPIRNDAYNFVQEVHVHSIMHSELINKRADLLIAVTLI